MTNHPSLPHDAPQWLRDADIENPDVTIEHGLVIWRDGEWRGGYWHGGEWHGGEWHGGVWRGGYWHGGYWRCGVWIDGEWRGGEWRDGEWHGGVWRGGVWRGGVWIDGEWHDGEWRGGVWRDGVWRGGESSPTRCQWPVLICDDTIRIGCKAMTVEEWDAFFASRQEFDTARGTEAFRLIHRAYMAARAGVMFDRENPPIK